MNSRITYKQVYRRMLMIAIVIINVWGIAYAQYERTDTIKRNMYLKFNLDINHRNFLLATVPNLYIITSGPHHHLGETYGRFRYYNDGQFDYDELLRIGTIGHQRTVFNTMLPYIVPNPYGEELFPGFILSPFHSDNRKFYRYTYETMGDSTYVMFRPRVRNSTLTRGSAMISNKTGRIAHAEFDGEHDHIEYHLGVALDGKENVPRQSQLQAKFRFLGNNISTKLHAVYDTITPTLPAKIKDSNDPVLMSEVRRDTLTQSEQAAYAEKYKEEPEDTIRHRHSILDGIWNAIDDYLISSIGFGSDKAHVHFSPILDPVGFGYSSSKGISYRMKFYFGWKISPNSHFDIDARGSYYFKQKRLYYEVPLRYTFNERKMGYAELYYASGNRISDSRIVDILQDNTKRDTINFDSLGLEHFNDRQLAMNVNIPIGRHFHLNLACVYHMRKAVNSDALDALGEQSVYKSFAPSVTFKYQPSRYVAWSVNYERGIPNVLGSDLKYERMEADVQMSKKYNALSSLNFRLGAGGYTQQLTTYFVDYVNFTENNLPDTWDEWKGDFYLLHSDLYNASTYYVRANLSYESPLLPLAYIPFLGYYIERECMYLNFVQLKHTRPYFELGYAFTTRFANFGLFASFFGSKFNEIGTKITFELFHNW